LEDPLAVDGHEDREGDDGERIGERPEHARGPDDQRARSSTEAGQDRVGDRPVGRVDVSGDPAGDEP
jgi:hypothetical protein